MEGKAQVTDSFDPKEEVLVIEEQEQEEDNELIECPNCKEIVPGHMAAAHTIQCYRNSTKCRICGDIILKSKKKEHLEKWRQQDVSQPIPNLTSVSFVGSQKGNHGR